MYKDGVNGLEDDIKVNMEIMHIGAIYRNPEHREAINKIEAIAKKAGMPLVCSDERDFEATGEFYNDELVRIDQDSLDESFANEMLEIMELKKWDMII